MSYFRSSATENSLEASRVVYLEEYLQGNNVQVVQQKVLVFTRWPVLVAAGNTSNSPLVSSTACTCISFIFAVKNIWSSFN